MLLENFDRFTESGRSYAPKITIRKAGQIGFNNGAVKKYDLENKAFVILYISKDKKQVATRFTNDPNEKGVIKLMKRNGNCFISCKTFLDCHEIDYKGLKKRSFTPDWHMSDQAAVIDLTEFERQDSSSGENIADEEIS